MSYSSEHQRMRPVLEKAREWDVSQNPDVLALFDPLLSGFNLWCNAFDQPRGWEHVAMDRGAYAQPCEFVGTCTWGWEGERITHLQLSTNAYALAERAGQSRYGRAFRNRADDVAWCTAKIEWLFQQAGVPCPPIRLEGER